MELDFGFLTTALIAVLGVVYVLYIAASVTREEMSIHDLCVRSHTLRNDYAKKLARLRGEDGFEEEVIMVDIVDEDGETEVAHEVAQAAKAA